MRIGRQGFVLSWKAFVLIIAALAAGGLLFVWSGLFNVGASSGHWPVTQWFLHWAMRSSVRTYALGIDPRPLNHAALVQRGAGHYASGCVPCHGAPGEPQSPVAREMTPMPPRLMSQIHDWDTNELFWIVKHGVKYGAMPAWVAQSRDDEVWAMVAFLERLPDMTPGEYRRLALGPAADRAGGGELIASLAEPLDAVLPECARCHGRDGAGRGSGAFPILTGQSEVYLYATLQAFAKGSRHSGIMQPAVSGLEDATLRTLAAHYAKAEAADTDVQSLTSKLLRKGERIARRGVRSDGVPACAVCHGLKDGPRRAAYPRLAGQYAGYLAQQLKLWQQGARGGTPFGPVMRMIAGRLNDDQIRAVAAFYASLSRQPALRASDDPRW